MPRPIYETAESKRAEAEVAAILTRDLGLGHLEKLPVAYALDFAVYAERDGAGRPCGLTGFVEVKDRSARFSWAEVSRQGYRIALAKWRHAAQLSRDCGVPCHFAIRCRDGLWVASLRPNHMVLPPVLHAGRTDRKVRCPLTGVLIPDPADTEPMVEIPANLFQQVR